MSDTTSKDDELWAELEDALVQSFEYGKGDTSKNPPILGMRRLKYLIKQYGTQERIDQAQKARNIMHLHHEESPKKCAELTQMLEDELTALKDMQETK